MDEAWRWKPLVCFQWDGDSHPKMLKSSLIAIVICSTGSENSWPRFTFIKVIIVTENQNISFLIIASDHDRHLLHRLCPLPPSPLLPLRLPLPLALLLLKVHGYYLMQLLNRWSDISYKSASNASLFLPLYVLFLFMEQSRRLSDVHIFSLLAGKFLYMCFPKILVYQSSLSIFQVQVS